MRNYFSNTIKEMVSFQDHSAKEKALNTLSSMSSAQIVSMSALHTKAINAQLGGVYGPASSVWSSFSPHSAAALNNPLGSPDLDVKPFNPSAFPQRPPVSLAGYPTLSSPLSAHGLGPAWEGRTVCTPKIR